jgi:uncharacterized membrane-anchored protein
MRKVPQITALFWAVKILTTALGESTSDFLVNAINPEIAVLFGAVVFVAALALQFRARTYNPWIYWFAVAMVAVFGTMAADVLHIGFGIPYIVTTVFFAAALAVVFLLWYAVEKNLSIHSIDTTRREMFYWLAVVTTFALGTAAGDLTATTLGFGYLVSGIVFAILIVVVAGAHYIFKSISAAEHRRQSRNAVLAFWLADILTRPLGASFADWMGKSHAVGGLGWGDGTVSATLTILIVCFVAYLAVTHRDVERGEGVGTY